MSQHSFDFGFRFYYHTHYKNVDENYQHRQHQRNYNDHGGYTPSELYIEAKYKSLKDELINNDIYSLSINELDISLIKTEKLLATFKAKSMRANQDVVMNDPLNYEINNYSPIKYSHILALVLYSDWTDLQCEFSKTFLETTDSKH